MIKKCKRIKKRIIEIIVLLTFIIVCSIIFNVKPTHADSGFGTSYSGGSSSGSSYSSSGSSYSSSGSSYSSSGSSYSGGVSSSTSGSSSSNGRGTSGIEFIFNTLLILAIPVAFVIKFIYNIVSIISFAKENKKAYTQPNITNIKINDTTVEDKIKQYIPDFDKNEFLDNGYKMYCDIQKAWMNFKLEDVRDILTDELFVMYQSQLSTLEVKGEQNIMKEFALKTSGLKDVDEQNGTITISTIYGIELYDYIADVNTGKVVRGDEKHKLRVSYIMKFRKTLDESSKLESCPNCGANLNINSTGICEYCNSKIVFENTKWVLSEKKVISQDTLFSYRELRKD